MFFASSRGLSRLDEIERSSFYGPSGFESLQQKQQHNRLSPFSQADQAQQQTQDARLTREHLQLLRLKGEG